MAAPAKARPKVFIPPPPLPEFWKKTTEGAKQNLASSSSSSQSEPKHKAKVKKSGKKTVTTVKVTKGAKVDILPPARPDLPPAKPAPNNPTSHATPIDPKSHSLPAVILPPPPPPTGLEKEDQTNMTYRYHYHHIHQPAVVYPSPAKVQQSQPARIITIPPPPPGFPGVPIIQRTTAQAPLAIYHICRICVRPRSEKYHIEHPIPSDGNPPPPGICRRCRVTSVEDKNEYTRVVHVDESDKVKFGLSAFVPKNNLVAREEATQAIKKQHDKGYVERFFREESSEGNDKSESERIIYRHVKQTRKLVPDPPPLQRAEVSVENLAAMNLMNDQLSPKLETRKTRVKAKVRSDSAAMPATGTYQPVGHEVYVAEVKKVDSLDASLSAHSSTSSRPSATIAKKPRVDELDSAKASVSVQTSVPASKTDVKASARATVPVPPGFTESEIRNFARDEVERYRQAERMMHAHPSAYAHGRLVPIVPEVPVERRIETVTEKVEPKPWETSPKKQTTVRSETVYASTRSRRTSVTSDKVSARVERVPDTYSRPSYRNFEDNETESRPSAARGAIKLHRPASSYSSGSKERAYEHDIEFTLERDQRVRGSDRISERSAPEGVRLKEVVGLIREEPAHSKHRSPSPRRGREVDVIEAIEEVELPPEPSTKPSTLRASEAPISQRVRILKGDPGTRERRYEHDAAASGWRPRSDDQASSRTDKSYWEDEGRVKTASRHSSTIQAYANATTGPRDPAVRAQTASVSTKSTVGSDDVVAMPSPRQHLPQLSTHGRSDDDSWYASRVKSVKKHQPRPSETVSMKAARDDDDKTVWPKDDVPRRPAASERPSLRDDWDWEYRKRVVQKADNPLRRPGNAGPEKERIEVERMLRRRRPSESTARESENTKVFEVRSRGGSERPPPTPMPTPNDSALSGSKQQPLPDRGRGPYMRTSEESAHVRFASKVEFSPTPPNSDEFLPEQIKQSKPSSKSSSKHERRSSLRNQIDGGVSEPPESVEDLITEYETTRARRGRSDQGRGDSDHMSARYTASAKGSGVSRARSPGSSRVQTSTHQSQASSHRQEDRPQREFVREIEPANERGSTTSWRRSQMGGRSSQAGTETATQMSRAGRLTRALSESPSREKLRLDYLRVQQQERDDAAESRGRWDTRESEIDGKGPYREEARTESLDALYGSGHGGPRDKAQKYVVREKW